jgi:outer membrane protein TolC
MMAQANAHTGLAKATFYPTVTLSASAGFETTKGRSWITGPSRFLSAGHSISETICDGGLRRATVQQFRERYDQTVANFHETVLVASQQVEENLAALRILSKEIKEQDTAIQSAQRSLSRVTDRYWLGLDPYLIVITAQTKLLGNQQIAVSLRIQHIVANVQLIEAVGRAGIPPRFPLRNKSSPGIHFQLPLLPRLQRLRILRLLPIPNSPRTVSTRFHESDRVNHLYTLRIKGNSECESPTRK